MFPPVRCHFVASWARTLCELLPPDRLQALAAALSGLQSPSSSPHILVARPRPSSCALFPSSPVWQLVNSPAETSSCRRCPRPHPHVEAAHWAAWMGRLPASVSLLPPPGVASFQPFSQQLPRYGSWLHSVPSEQFPPTWIRPQSAGADAVSSPPPHRASAHVPVWPAPPVLLQAPTSHALVLPSPPPAARLHSSERPPAPCR
mmetsp:Transcript_83573/g.132342  ORF Transcript_83573/g.132342 Transcript_83573/m.132342 type:complete len:203 (-) Transcript_83573:603-1211(-)